MRRLVRGRGLLEHVSDAAREEQAVGTLQLLGRGQFGVPDLSVRHEVDTLKLCVRPHGRQVPASLGALVTVEPQRRRKLLLCGAVLAGGGLCGVRMHEGVRFKLQRQGQSESNTHHEVMLPVFHGRCGVAALVIRSYDGFICDPHRTGQNEPLLFNRQLTLPLVLSAQLQFSAYAPRR